MKLFDSFCNSTYKIIMAAAMIFGIIMLSCSALQVFSRYVLNNTFSWTDECARYCFIWMNLLGAAGLVRTHGHSLVDVISSKFKGKPRKVYDFIFSVCVIYICGILAVYGFKLCQITAHQASTALKLPMGLVYGAIPLMGLLSCIFELNNMMHSITGKGMPGQEKEAN